MAITLDVVIPSYRLEEQYLLPILQLATPANTIVNYYLVADNPQLKVPKIIAQLSTQSNIHLIVNPQNMGFSRTRNIGIDAGQGDWILLLDDDITPEPDLLQVYADQINLNPNALGFIGVTDFPEPINAVTQALKITGVSTHFARARHEDAMYWSATANIVLNRKKLGARRFLPELTKSTEDMELLFRNAYENGLEKYISVPLAVVHHPWWGNGSMQTRRLFFYGAGAAEAAQLNPIKQYNFYDFTNTAETLLLLGLAAITALILHVSLIYIGILALAQLLAEWITDYYRTIKIDKTYSPGVALQVFWHKNMMEVGRLWTCLSQPYIKGFAQRTDGSFAKPHPSPFRLNRWKIIKLSVFLLLSLIMILLYTSW